MITTQILFFNLILCYFVGFSSNASLNNTISEEIIVEKVRQLYTPDDEVEILTSENFRNKIENSSRAWVVEFYLSWCGGCQRFAPSWRAFALDIYSWKDLVEIGVLDCAIPTNIDLCKKYKISKYPTLLYFHENYQTTSENLGTSIPHHENRVDFHRHYLIDQIIQEEREGRGIMYPYLLPYTHPNVSHLFESSDTLYVFLIIEPVATYLGAAVALDLHKTPNISVRYAFSNNSALVNNLQIEEFPSIIVIDYNGNFQVLGNTVSRREVKLIIAKFLEDKGIEMVEEVSNRTEISNEYLINSEPKKTERVLLRKRIKKMGDVVFQMDLETAVRYSLKHEVGSVKTIKDEQLEVLASYLDVLKKYFPFGHDSSPFLRELRNAVSNVTELGGSTIAEIVQRAELKQNVFSSPEEFLACEGSSVRYRGYPCSVWKLFHYLTVNAVRNFDDNNVNNPREILDVLYGYVKYFFGCSSCSEHFLKMSEERNLTNVESTESAILWLWSAHNVVNDRLAGDITEDPEYPKYQFPSQKHCPQCVKSDGFGWNTDEVLKYLKNMYHRDNVRYIGSNTSILFPGLAYY